MPQPDSIPHGKSRERSTEDMLAKYSSVSGPPRRPPAPCPAGPRVRGPHGRSRSDRRRPSQRLRWLCQEAGFLFDYISDMVGQPAIRVRDLRSAFHYQDLVILVQSRSRLPAQLTDCLMGEIPPLGKGVGSETLPTAGVSTFVRLFQGNRSFEKVSPRFLRQGGFIRLGA